MTKLFCYGTLNVHEIQRELWGEAKEGETGHLADYELRLWPKSNIFYVERMVGETVAGKIYELDDEQIKRTDLYETEAYERISIPKEGIEVYVRAKGKSLK